MLKYEYYGNKNDGLDEVAAGSGQHRGDFSADPITLNRAIARFVRCVSMSSETVKVRLGADLCQIY